MPVTFSGGSLWRYAGCSFSKFSNSCTFCTRSVSLKAFCGNE